MALSDLAAGLVSSPSLDMVESGLAGLEAIPVDVSNDSDDSDAAVANNDIVASLWLEHGSAIKEIFQAAQQLSHQDRVDAADERRRSQKLWDFILSHGFSAQAINDFVTSGTISQNSNAHEVFDKSSLRTGSVDTIVPVGKEGRGSPHIVTCAESGLEEGELPRSPTTFPPVKQSWSSIVAQGEPISSLKLEYHPPLSFCGWLNNHKTSSWGSFEWKQSMGLLSCW